MEMVAIRNSCPRLKLSIVFLAFLLTGPWAQTQAGQGVREEPTTFNARVESNAELWEVPDRTQSFEAKEVRPEDLGKRSVLIGVFTRAHDYGRREVIRATWFQFLENSNFYVKFIVGSPPAVHNPLDFKALAPENETFGDMLLVDALETNAYLKALHFFSWASKQNPGYDFVVKCDSDTWVHPYNLQLLIAKLPKGRAYWGKMAQHSHYFNHGGFYVASRDIVQWVGDHMNALTSGAPQTGVVEKEDVYFGWWAKQYGLKNGEVLFAHPWEWISSGEDRGPAEALFHAICVHGKKQNMDYLSQHVEQIEGLDRWQACMKLGYPTEDCQALLKPFSTGKTSFLNHTEFWIKLTPGYWKNLQEYKGALSTALRAPPGSTYVDPDADKVAIVPGDGIAPARMLRGGRRPGPSRGF